MKQLVNFTCKIINLYLSQLLLNKVVLDPFVFLYCFDFSQMSVSVTMVARSVNLLRYSLPPPFHGSAYFAASKCTILVTSIYVLRASLYNNGSHLVQFFCDAYMPPYKHHTIIIVDCFNSLPSTRSWYVSL